jgi:hypothetical protein
VSTGSSGTGDDLFDWDSVPPEPGESHGLPDWYPRRDEDTTDLPKPLEEPPPHQPWWSKPVSFSSMWRGLCLLVVVALGLTKVVVFLVVARVDLAAAHAGIATDLVAYGLVLLLSGFTMRWTAWGFGLGQVLRPDLYDDIGLWLLWLGAALSLIGSVAVVAIEYMP